MEYIILLNVKASGLRSPYPAKFIASESLARRRLLVLAASTDLKAFHVTVREIDRDFKTSSGT
jgi:hypothetical protein